MNSIYLPKINMLKPGKIRCMLEIDSTVVGTKFMSELDKEMTPILAELITLSTEIYNEHPTVKKLFDWLVASDRTGEEFYYVVGPLQEYVLKVMMEHFGYSSIPGRHLGKVAIEALAEICPVLEGPWEKAAWVVWKESTESAPDDYGYASDKLTAWLINVIGGPVICPNPYLRIEFINLLNVLVDFELEEHKSLQPKAVKSVLFACSYLNLEYLIESKPQYGYYHKMNIINVMYALDYFTIEFDEFDKNLAKKLQNVKSLRLTAHVCDFAYNHAVNAIKFVEPIELQGLTVILKIINYYIQLNYRDYKTNNSDLFLLDTGISSTTYLLKIFINIFTRSCWTPHLIGLTSTCILTTMEIVMSDYAINECPSNECSEGFSYISDMLEDLFDENIFNPEMESPEIMMVMFKYKERLHNIKNNC